MQYHVLSRSITDPDQFEQHGILTVGHSAGPDIAFNKLKKTINIDIDREYFLYPMSHVRFFKFDDATQKWVKDSFYGDHKKPRI